MRIVTWQTTIALCLTASGAAAQVLPLDPSIDSAIRASVVDSLCVQLHEQYLDAGEGERICNAVRVDLRSGRFDRDSTAQTLARNLTRRLRAASGNRHMNVLFVSADAPPSAPETWQQPYPRNGFGDVAILAGNVAYVEIFNFNSVRRYGAEVDSNMTSLNTADAVIFDVQQNSGGSPEMVAHVVSWLLDGGQPLMEFRHRRESASDTTWTRDRVPGSRLTHVPVAVLVSGSTISAAEEFAYDLAATGRAVIIGGVEGTAGAALPGNAFPIGHDFGMFVSSGSARHLVTGENWEGVGIIPDYTIRAVDRVEFARRLLLSFLGRSVP
jgi:retinol-binding protein 3